jgi:outer membrane protein TolC
LPKQLLDAARQRWEGQRAYYEEGRITIDRFIRASEKLMEAERNVATTDAERLAAMQRHVERMKELAAREKAEFDVGKGTRADLAEATLARVEAEILLKKARETPTTGDLGALDRRLSIVERKLDQLLNEARGKKSR